MWLTALPSNYLQSRPVHVLWELSTPSVGDSEHFIGIHLYKRRDCLVMENAMQDICQTQWITEKQAGQRHVLRTQPFTHTEMQTDNMLNWTEMGRCARGWPQLSRSRGREKGKSRLWRKHFFVNYVSMPLKEKNIYSGSHHFQNQITKWDEDIKWKWPN